MQGKKHINYITLVTSHVICEVCKSPQAKDFFLKCCVEKGLCPRELIAFCNTRWQSMKDVLDRYILNEKVEFLSYFYSAISNK